VAELLAAIADLESRIAALEGSDFVRVRPAKTGQTQCWAASGASIACTGTGQDGEYQYGSDPAVAPSSGTAFGGYDRTTILNGASDPGFTDKGDGTVTDELTGLTWLKNANCFETKSWQAALDSANGLANGLCNLSDGSVAGEWRLANINELRSLFDRDQGIPFLPAGHPFTDVQSFYYWSSTSADALSPSLAWAVGTVDSQVAPSGKETQLLFIWPVRDTQ
jgi:hypothetical protein